ncbi:uncharacterized protein LOC100897505 [Galendromus occidentalis]|uniref:Uncharacterized protein LOC100897505 n=1 Tax=Galendromus occidentalis TaxID=34638 RepID=A0AAJ6W0Q6_9ACAR|nr:uncharacterized protein LOC100897505 [Galendromus occidentalis]
MEEPRATSFCVRMWLITATIAICLICTCFVMVKAPETKVEVSSTDMLLLDGVSGLWCQGQELVSTHKFNVYRFNDPEQSNTTKTRTEIDNVLVRLHIGPRKYQYLRYFLLSGSSVSVVAESDRRHRANGTVNVVKGKDEMNRCLKDLDEHANANDTDSEEDLNFAPVGHRRYKYLRWALKTRLFTGQSRGSLEVTASEDDHFHLIIVNDSNETDLSVTLRVSLTRIRFLVDGDDIVCNKVKHCLHHVGFGTDVRLVLDIPREPDAGRSMFVVRSVCRPRVFFYALLFILIPIIMLLITGLVIKAYSTLLTLPLHNRHDIRSRIARRIQTQLSVETGPSPAAPRIVQHAPPREYMQVLYHIPNDQGLMDRTPTPGTPPPSYASLEKSRKLTPPICCDKCLDRFEDEKPLMPPPPTYRE